MDLGTSSVTKLPKDYPAYSTWRIAVQKAQSLAPKSGRAGEGGERPFQKTWEKPAELRSGGTQGLLLLSPGSCPAVSLTCLLPLEL